MTRHTLHLGDCLEVLRTMPDASVDSVVTDPPYGLSDHKPAEVIACLSAWLAGEPYEPKGKGFMGKSWDAWVPGPEVWREVLRVLKPGGHVLAFAGTRSMDLMSMAIRLGGFELRDSIGWAHDDGGAPLLAYCFGSGFPKSLNVAAAIEKLAEPKAEPKAEEVEFCAWLRANSSYDLVCSILGKRFWDCEVQIVNTATKDKPIMGRRALVPTAARWQKFKAEHGAPIPERIDELAKPEPTRYETPGEEWSPGKGQGTAGQGEWAGFGTSLKPAWEPVILARRPLEGTVAENVLAHGTGGINVDGCRISALTGQRPDDTLDAWEQEKNLCDSCARLAASPAKPGTPAIKGTSAGSPAEPTTSGRGESARADTGKADTGCSAGLFPAELATDQTADSSLSTGASGKTPTGRSRQATKSTTSTATNSTTGLKTCGACGCSITDPATSGSTQASKNGTPNTPAAQENAAPIGRWPSNFIHDGSDEVVGLFPQAGAHGGKGTFRQHTWAGNGKPTEQEIMRDDTGSAARFFYTAKADKKERKGSKHPTVKPLDLMRYLCRLVTPPGGVVLDPYCGSGTTIEAALAEGFQAIGIERDPESFEDTQRRLDGAQLGLSLGA